MLVDIAAVVFCMCVVFTPLCIITWLIERND